MAKRRWWRPRFSVRTLAIVVTLICVYFAAWEITKKYGATTTKETLFITKNITGERSTAIATITESSPMPFLVRRDGGIIVYPETNPRYYLWLFGHRIQLPFGSQWKKLSEIMHANGATGLRRDG